MHSRSVLPNSSNRAYSPRFAAAALMPEFAPLAGQLMDGSGLASTYVDISTEPVRQVGCPFAIGEEGLNT